MIIGISGQVVNEKLEVLGSAGAGKDTMADRLVAKHEFVKIGMADEIKRACQRFFDFTDDQLWGPSESRSLPDARYPLNSGTGHLTARYALRLLGTEFGRACYQDVWIDQVLRTIKQLESGGYYYDQKSGLRVMSAACSPAIVPKTNVVIPDVRFCNELAAIRAVGGKVVRIVRVKAGEVPSAFAHASEVEVMGLPHSDFDYVVENNLDKHCLELNTDKMIDTIKGKILDYDETQVDVPPYLRKKV